MTTNNHATRSEPTARPDSGPRDLQDDIADIWDRFCELVSDFNDVRRRVDKMAVEDGWEEVGQDHLVVVLDQRLSLDRRVAAIDGQVAALEKAVGSLRTVILGAGAALRSLIDIEANRQ